MCSLGAVRQPVLVFNVRPSSVTNSAVSAVTDGSSATGMPRAAGRRAPRADALHNLLQDDRISPVAASPVPVPQDDREPSTGDLRMRPPVRPVKLAPMSQLRSPGPNRPPAGVPDSPS